MLHHSDDSPSWTISWFVLRLWTATLNLHPMVAFANGYQVSSIIDRAECSTGVFVTIAGPLAMLNSWYAKFGSYVYHQDWRSVRGYNSFFGVFETYYTAHIGNSASQNISWIASVKISALFFIGTLSSRLTDAGDFRIAFAAGTLLNYLSVFMASLSTTLWQLLLSQGLCTGLGNGLMFTPSLAVVSTYFKRRRALAFGITATGSATAGLKFPSMAR